MPEKYSKEWFVEKGREGGFKSREKLREKGLLSEHMKRIRLANKNKVLTSNDVPPTVDISDTKNIENT